MPLKESHGRHIDKHILAGLRKEALSPHLYLDGLGRVLDNLDDDHVAKTPRKSHDPLNDVDDETA